MSTVTMSEARQTLPEIVNRVAFGGERVVINRSGKEIAALISIEDLATLRLLEDHEDLKAARAAIAEVKKKGTVPWRKLKESVGL